MIVAIYIIILIYFILGGIGFYFINRKKEKSEARNNWTKFITYFVIIHTLFLAIVFSACAFQIISLLIILAGILEIIRLFSKSGYAGKGYFFLSLLIFTAFGAGFILFSTLDRYLILFTFLVLSVFDAFSQVSGQLMGKRKILPYISPSKTAEGLIGGMLMALLSSILLKGLVERGTNEIIILVSGIILFAFAGDVATSWYKRKYGVKDFGKIIPGHGGVLDRFDSLIAGGAFVALLQIFF